MSMRPFSFVLLLLGTYVQLTVLTDIYTCGREQESEQFMKHPFQVGLSSVNVPML